MRVNKNSLPQAPEGTTWSVRQWGDHLTLRLRTQGWPWRTLGRWSTSSLSRLTPGPEEAVQEVAAQLVATVDARAAA